MGGLVGMQSDGGLSVGWPVGQFIHPFLIARICLQYFLHNCSFWCDSLMTKTDICFSLLGT